MITRRLLLALGLFLSVPSLACADAGHKTLDLQLWTVTPFVVLLLCIAILPLATGHWWHSNRNKAIVSALAGVPVACYLAYLHFFTAQNWALAPLGHELFKYFSFIVLLGSLYTVSGGIVLRGDIRATPFTNAGFLLLGAVLANLIGTTGASVLLIRPMLRINKQRQKTGHLPIFFIFLVGNLGGLLTPLGDPPLFLGYLEGVPFTWTLRLWPQWLVVNGVVLAIFLVWDSLAYGKEVPAALARDRTQIDPLRVQGLFNLLLLGGIVGGVLIQGVVPGQQGELFGAGIMIVMALLSLATTKKELREANGFNWEPIVEVAVLFAGIFVAMVPALQLLEGRGKELGLTQPWQFFWLTGSLSSFLDNAPTYLAFATMAASPDKIASLVGSDREILLQAVSCGAVMMGAMTYIGNGPNFMVKAIADQAGYRTPSFFGYLVYSCFILLPCFVLVTFLFFPPR